MSIRRRPVTAEQSKGNHRFRHPMLKHGSNHFLVYSYVCQNPGCTASAIRSLVTSGGALSDLVREGLIKREGTSRASYRYTAVAENALGPGRDRVEVEVTVFVNRFGEYSVSAKLLGQHLTAHEDEPRPVHTQTLQISVPKPEEIQERAGVEEAEILEVIRKPRQAEFLDDRGALTIDGDYSIIRSE